MSLYADQIIQPGQAQTGGSKSYNNEQPGVAVDTAGNKAKRMTFVLPFLLSALFYGADCIHLINDIVTAPEGTYDWTRITILFTELLLGYFPVTFISMVAAAFLQQLLYKVPAGLDKDKIEGLFYFFVAYIVVFTIYLTAKILQWTILMFMVVGLTVWFGLWIWRALEVEVRKPTVAQSDSTKHFVGNNS